jgi:hypothetical protein
MRPTNANCIAVSQQMAPLTDYQRRQLALTLAFVSVANRFEAFTPVAEVLGVEEHEMARELFLVTRYIPPERHDVDLIARYSLHVHALPCGLEARKCNFFVS